MGRAKFIVMLAIAIVFYLHSFTLAQRPEDAMRNARSLLSDAYRLRGLLDSAGADAFTIRPACRLEATAEELVEKPSCVGHAEQAVVLVDDCILWYNRTCVGVRRECRLADDRTIASAMSCTGRQLTLLADAVDCMLRHRGGAPKCGNTFFSSRMGSRRRRECSHFPNREFGELKAGLVGRRRLGRSCKLQILALRV